MDYISGTTMPPNYEETYRKEYENKIRNKAIDDCIKILDTKEPKYYDVLLKTSPGPMKTHGYI